MDLFDTHCHIHEAQYPYPADEALARAHEAGVSRLICIGTDEASSQQAVDFASQRENVWATVGLHPHEAKNGQAAIDSLDKLVVTSRSAGKIVAIGECGLDYFYNHSPRDQQIDILHAQCELATKHDLPMVFHVREAFDDFWPIFDEHPGLRGVLHSFTDTIQNMERGLSAGLYIGVNGIATFTKNDDQKTMYARVPLENMLLETDAPFLTPVPNRGKVNEPAFVGLVAASLANVRSVEIEQIAATTTHNAQKLFNI